MMAALLGALWLAGVQAPAQAPAPAAAPAAAPARMAPRVAFAADTPVSARPRRRDEGPDRWFAEDKVKHFLMSYAVTTVGYAFARSAGLRHGEALAAGTGAGMVAGVWKEARDRRSGGDVSARDLAWDVLGVVAGSQVAARTR